VGQEVAHHEGELVERELGEPTQLAYDPALVLAGLPGQTVRTGRVVKAIFRPTLAPLADRLGAE
jgi:hypothetical protein